MSRRDDDEAELVRPADANPDLLEEMDDDDGDDMDEDAAE